MKQMSKSKVLVAALALGVVTSGLVYVYLANQSRRMVQDIRVVVAKRDIPEGTIIDPSMVTTAMRPKNVVPDQTAVSAGAVSGRVAERPISAGEPITFTAAIPKNRLAHVVPPFMRAVTVGVDPVSGVGGFLKPGDRVDVVATFDLNDGTVTKTVLQDVELLATGNQAEEVSNNQAKGRQVAQEPSPTATVAVLPKDAEKLILADARGKIRLMLRRGDDTSVIPTKGVTGRAVIGNVPPDAPPKQEKTPAPPTQKMVITSVQSPAAAQGTAQRPVAASQRPQQVVVRPKTGVKPPVAQPKPERKVQVIRGTSVEETVVPE